MNFRIIGCWLCLTVCLLHSFADHNNRNDHNKQCGHTGNCENKGLSFHIQHLSFALAVSLPGMADTVGAAIIAYRPPFIEIGYA